MTRSACVDRENCVRLVIGEAPQDYERVTRRPPLQGRVLEQRAGCDTAYGLR